MFENRHDRRPPSSKSFIPRPDWSSEAYETAVHERDDRLKRTALKSMRMTRDVYEAIRSEIGHRRAEQGGMLGGDRDEGIVRSFHFDDSARRTGGTYTPDHVFLNRLLDENWNPK